MHPTDTHWIWKWNDQREILLFVQFVHGVCEREWVADVAIKIKQKWKTNRWDTHTYTTDPLGSHTQLNFVDEKTGRQLCQRLYSTPNTSIEHFSRANPIQLLRTKTRNFNSTNQNSARDSHHSKVAIFELCRPEYPPNASANGNRKRFARAQKDGFFRFVVGIMSLVSPSRRKTISFTGKMGPVPATFDSTIW